MKTSYYSLAHILETNAHYNVIIGERSNGKTFSVLEYGLSNYCKGLGQLGIIRRWEEDFKGKNGEQMCQGLINTNKVSEYTKGQYNSIYYYSKRWFLCLLDENGERIKTDANPFCLGFALTSEEHYKSTAYPDITTILFDEFITREYYLPDEFITFQNLLSTIIRLRTNVKIFMCGNTVNKYCPYFNEMGLNHIKYMIKGKIDVYEYGATGLRVAVEYSDFKANKKASNIYFAFDNPKLKMITDGEWEISIYPHLPYKYKPDEIIYTYYINFNKELLQCEIIYKKDEQLMFTFIHRKTTPIKDIRIQLVYQQEYDARPNYRRKINISNDKISKKILSFYKTDKVFYQDNEVGEIVRNYLLWCEKESQ